MQTGGILTFGIITAAAFSGGAAQVASGNELSLVGAVATQVPALAVLCVVVWVFVKHLRETSEETRKAFRDMHAEATEARRDAIESVKGIAEHCHDVQNRSIEVQRAAAVTMEAVKGAVNTLTTAVDSAERARAGRSTNGG